MMLPRLLLSDKRGPALTPCMHRPLAGNEVAASKAADDASYAVTERERRVLAFAV